MIRKIALLSIAILLVFSCYRDNKEEIYQNYEPCVIDTTLQVTYTADIAPLLATNCALGGCHNSKSRQSGLDLSTYADARKIALNDKLINRVTGSGSIMPPSGSLRQCDIDKLQIWVNEGALNN